MYDAPRAKNDVTSSHAIASLVGMSTVITADRKKLIVRLRRRSSLSTYSLVTKLATSSLKKKAQARQFRATRRRGKVRCGRKYRTRQTETNFIHMIER